MRIAHAAGVAYAVEKLQNLDGAFAAQGGSVAEHMGLHLSAFGLLRELCGECRERIHRRRGIEQVLDHLEHEALARELFEQLAHHFLSGAMVAGQVAHPGRVKAAFGDGGQQALGQRLLGVAQLHGMTGQMQPGAAAGDLAGSDQRIEQAVVERIMGAMLQGWQGHAAQAGRVDARFIGCQCMKALQGLQQLVLQRLPGSAGHQQRIAVGQRQLGAVLCNGRVGGTGQPHQL